MRTIAFCSLTMCCSRLLRNSFRTCRSNASSWFRMAAAPFRCQMARWTMKSFSPTEAVTSNTQPSMRMMARPCVTPPAPLAIRKVCCTRTAPWCCIRLLSWASIRSRSATMTLSSQWLRCFTPTPGACLILPGPNVDPESVLDLISQEHVTIACGVPTVWLSVLATLEKNPGRWKFDWPVRIVIGGSAPPERLMRALDKHNLHILHLWGMTETTPLATVGKLKRHMGDWTADEQYEVRAKQGWPAPFIELRVMRPEGPEEKSVEAPRDGKTPGELEVRGPWVAASYYHSPDQAHRWTEDGWFKTGDVATICDEGFVKIVDRAKDLVKSGGEWISSVDIENTLMGHPAVKEAAVVGVPHPKWQERPLAAVVLKDGAQVTPEELRTFLAQTFAKWQLPDAFVFLEALPRTSVGKFKKTALREQFANW